MPDDWLIKALKEKSQDVQEAPADRSYLNTIDDAYNRYSNAFTSGYDAVSESFNTSKEQLSEGKYVPGLINSLITAALVPASPFVSGFSLMSEASQDIFGKQARGNLDKALDVVGTGAKELDALASKVGIDTKKIDESLISDKDTREAITKGANFAGTALVFGGFAKAKANFKGKAEPLEGKINLREQKRQEILNKRKETTESTVIPITQAKEGGVVNNARVKEGKIDPKVIENNVIESTKAEQVKIVREETTKKAPNEIEGNKSKKTARSNSENPITPTNGEGIRSGITYKEPKATEVAKEQMVQKEAIKEPISVEVPLNAYKKAHEVLNKDMKFDEFMDKVVQKEVNDRIVERNNKKIEEIKEKHQIIKPDAYKQAQENIKKNLGKLNAGLDPTILKDYAIVGMYHLEGGYRTFKSWAKKMNDEFGDEINPYLRDIYKSMHKDYAKEIRQFRARTPLPTPEKRGTTKGYNEDKMLSGNEDVIPELQKLGSKFDEIRNVTLTNEQSIKAGREYAKELTDSKVMDLQPGTTKNAVEATGLRIYTETRFQKANENYKQALKSGDEQAKADAFREFNKTALMYAKVRGVGSSVAQATQSFNIKMDTAIDKSIKDYINAARERGLNELADKLQSEINKVPQGATWKDKVSYVFYNILLSNPLTQVANLGGNATHFTTEIISRVIDPATNKKALLKGLRSGLKSGLKEMKEIYTQEKSIEDSKFLAGVQFDWYPKNKVTRALRGLIPTTELAMVDGFFRGVARGMETENVKTSLSKRFNESMKDVEKNIQEVLKDPFTDSKKLQEYAKELEQIEKYIDYMVFQTPLKSPLGKAISKSLVMRPIIPFARVPANIIKVGLDWSPGGFMRLLGQKGKEYTPKERQHIIRRAMVGTMFTMGIMKGITDGRIEVTGQGPEDSRDRELWEKAGYKPNHIYINGTGYSYQNVNPFNIQLALIGNVSDLLKYDTKYFQDKDKDIVEKMGKVTLGFASTLTDQTFLQGLSSIFQAMTYQDGKYFSRLAVSLGTPNIISFPKNVREYWEDKKHSYRADNVSEMFQRKIGNTEGLVPRRTILGGDIRESGFERFVFNPTSLKSDEDSKIAKYFLDSGLRISSLQKDKNMTAEEFDKYQQKAGELVWQMIKENLDKIKKLREKDIEKAQDYIDRRVQERKRAAKIKIKRSK